MDKQFSQRTRVLIGDAGMDRLERASVALFGVGGVGSYAAEALVRAGVGNLSLIDFDHVRASNLNRQLPATTATLGQLKVAAMGDRLKLINPELCLTLHPLRFQRRLADAFLADGYDFVIDAIDSLSAKVNLIQECLDRGVPIISSMGSASKLRSEMVRVGDLFEVVGCPLARLVRKRLRRRAINRGVPVIYSTELPILCGRSAGGAGEVEPTANDPTDETEGQGVHGTVSYMPGLFGLHCAGYVVQRLLADIPFVRRGQTPRTGC